VQPPLAERSLTSDGVREVRVARVDHDVAGLQERDQLVDDGIRRRAGLDHHDDRAGHAQRGDEVLDRLRREEGAFAPVLGDEGPRARDRPVVHRDRVSVAGQVPREVPPHHREARDTDLSARRHDVLLHRRRPNSLVRPARRSTAASPPGLTLPW